MRHLVPNEPIPRKFSLRFDHPLLTLPNKFFIIREKGKSQGRGEGGRQLPGTKQWAVSTPRQRKSRQDGKWTRPANQKRGEIATSTQHSTHSIPSHPQDKHLRSWVLLNSTYATPWISLRPRPRDSFRIVFFNMFAHPTDRPTDRPTFCLSLSHPAQIIVYTINPYFTALYRPSPRQPRARPASFSILEHPLAQGQVACKRLSQGYRRISPGWDAGKNNKCKNK